MKKTSWTLLLFLMVVLMTVGMAYGQGFELFPLQSNIQPGALARTGIRNFQPPFAQAAQCLKLIADPQPIDYAGILLARAEAENEDANCQDENPEDSSPAKTTPVEKTVTAPKKTAPASSKEKPPAEDRAKEDPVKDTEPAPSEPPPAKDPPPDQEPAAKPLKAPAGTTHTAQEKKTFDLVNHARAAEGLAPLKVHTELIWLARLKSEDLVEHDVFTHDSPTYGRMGQMIRDAGISISAWGENLARCSSPERAVELWLSSTKGHRENILSTNFTHTGVGIAYIDSSRMVVTQVFILPK